jgi:hypothetical protein
VSGLSIGYAVGNSTRTAAGNDLTDLELIEVFIVAGGPMTAHPSAGASPV